MINTEHKNPCTYIHAETTYREHATNIKKKNTHDTKMHAVNTQWYMTQMTEMKIAAFTTIGSWNGGGAGLKGDIVPFNLLSISFFK